MAPPWFASWPPSPSTSRWSYPASASAAATCRLALNRRSPPHPEPDHRHGDVGIAPRLGMQDPCERRPRARWQAQIVLLGSRWWRHRGSRFRRPPTAESRR
jgi:hypothetical protein